MHNMTPDVIAYLEESIAQREHVQLSHKNSFEKWWKNNTDFHIKISSCAGNALLTNMVRRTMAILWRATAQFFWNQEPTSYWTYHSGGHVAILEALKANDKNTLADVITQDVVALKKIFEIS
jgi:DNA-binding GntR family transcriptional regulator